ncbi:HlyD family efflux transporter periplasmic adaptor subunit [Lusitaniella coriacea LEGE 07157]|uniref:HlyD family efflux transporter periplasmic adaptor subunit n=1 Tax=Lusitaniella coriacea LEGE 07157 TaxID=945747 RepID=A0A8J7E029_9CYAN|nr:HlyD family efflux transporter periplasmic adaptor subunit [Lusitaniella coriacea]MBE9118568.1 HlyD family efflux transporter periplasmic adaptor subunit [Lusitaniella coriacea LEGE 07157]
MTNPQLNPSSSPNTILKVVPPQQQKKESPKQPEKLAPPKEENPPQKKSFNGLKTMGAIAVAVGIIGFIPIPNYVTGETKITSRTKARQLIAMPASGRVKIYVQTNEKIQPGQKIAEIQSDDLDNQLTEAERELERAKMGVNAAQQQFIVAQTRLNAAQNNEAIARNRTHRQLTEINNRSSHPQIRRIEREKEMIPQEIAAIEADIAGVEAEIIGLREQLNSATEKVSSYESLELNGAVPRFDLLDARSQKAALTAQIQQRESFIAAKHHQIQQKNSLMAAKSEQGNEASKKMGDTLYNYEDDFAQIRAQTQTAAQELEASAAEVQAQQQLVAKWEASFKQLRQQREKLKLVAEVAGTVTSRDLDLKQNKRLEVGEEILRVVDLKQLTAEVKIRQEDKDLVESGAAVKFYRQGGTSRYAAIVQDEGISPVVQTEEKQQKPMLNVRILIDNEDRLLLPGIGGYAHIQTPKLRVYQKVGHEFNKLFNLGKYFPWLSGN